MSESLMPQSDKNDHSPTETDDILAMAKEAALRVIRHSKKDSDGEARRAIAEKILDKAEVKSSDLSLDSGNVDSIDNYRELKRLGIFIIRDAVAKFDYEDTETGFKIQEGDSYIDLHLPPVPEESRNKQTVEDSLRMIAKYIAINEIDAKYVMGVTYEKMARLAEKGYGFHITYPSAKSLPERTAKSISEIYELSKKAGMKGNDMGAPTIVYLTIDELRDRTTK
jgi:hypothetical protein